MLIREFGCWGDHFRAIIGQYFWVGDWLAFNFDCSDCNWSELRLLKLVLTGSRPISCEFGYRANFNFWLATRFNCFQHCGDQFWGNSIDKPNIQIRVKLVLLSSCEPKGQWLIISGPYIKLQFLRRWGYINLVLTCNSFLRYPKLQILSR